MGKEIERKFLVIGEAWRGLAQGTLYRQGYLNSAKERTVRVRTVGDRAFLTIKGLTVGASRVEYEYEIPFEDGNFLLDNLAEKPIIEKKRYRIPQGKFVWEIDEFFGENQGLIVAEIELDAEDQAFSRPPWLGEEVSKVSRYLNVELSRLPYTAWNREEQRGEK